MRTPFRLTVSALASFLMFGYQLDRPPQVAFRLQASLGSKGDLLATGTLKTTGAAGEKLRDEFLADFNLGKIPASMNSLLMDRRLSIHLSSGEATDGSFEAQFSIKKEDFVVPFQRWIGIQLNTVKLAPQPQMLPDGPPIVTPGVFREQIELEVPPDVQIRNVPPVRVEGRFGRYQSDILLYTGKLTIVRRLELKPLFLELSDKAGLEQFLKTVRDDQARTFQLTRRRDDFSEWLKTVSSSQSNDYAARALRELDYPTARRLYEITLKDNPADETALIGLARAQIYLGDLPGARANYKKVLTINPGSFYGYVNLASIDLREGRWESALANYEKQLELRPDDPFTIANVSVPLVHLGRWADAEQASIKASRFQSANPPLQTLRAALARICQGKVRDAKAQIEAALGGPPASRYLDTIQDYLIACGKEPDLADYYLRQDQTGLPESIYNPRSPYPMPLALANQNGQVIILYRRGWLQATKGNNEEAVALLEDSASLSLNVETLYRLALVKWRLGQVAEAHGLWRSIALMAPTHIWEEVPDGITEDSPDVPRVSADGQWYVMPHPQTEAPAVLGKEPAYFFVVAKPDGAVETVRPIDTDDPLALQMLPQMRALVFPRIRTEGVSRGSVHLVKIARREDDTLAVFRSTTGPVTLLVEDLAPNEFPRFTTPGAYPY